METIKSKRMLHSAIRAILESEGDTLKTFPVSFTFSEGMGQPVFTFTVERSDPDYLIDATGKKWVRA